MPKNLEIKARLKSISRGKEIARRIGARYAGEMKQVDTYFDAPAGRLKLREINRKSFELISYSRPNSKSSRYSDYRIIRLEEPSDARMLLTKLYGVRIVIRKVRVLYRFQNARIHLDQVKGLGAFLEFEVVVTKGNQQARRLMAYLRREFDIVQSSLIGGSYSDMGKLEKKRKR